MSIVYPDIKSVEDANDWCRNLYNELKQPFVTYAGNKTVWEDYVTPIGANTNRGANNNPTLTKIFDDGSSSEGIYVPVFADGDEGIITAQIPHCWKEGSRIYPHIHYFVMTYFDPGYKFKI
jgi:hypothetical protein